MLRWPNGRGRNGGEKGQNVVEFALVLPIFLLLLFGIIEFGLALFNDITLTNAAREGARLGAIGASSGNVQTRAQNTSDPLVNCSPDPPTVTVAYPDGADPGDRVVVTIECEYGFITPLSGLFPGIPGSLTIRSSADMRLE